MRSRAFGKAMKELPFDSRPQALVLQALARSQGLRIPDTRACSDTSCSDMSSLDTRAAEEAATAPPPSSSSAEIATDVAEQIYKQSQNGMPADARTIRKLLRQLFSDSGQWSESRTCATDVFTSCEADADQSRSLEDLGAGDRIPQPSAPWPEASAADCPVSVAASGASSSKIPRSSRSRSVRACPCGGLIQQSQRWSPGDRSRRLTSQPFRVQRRLMAPFQRMLICSPEDKQKN